LSDPANTQATRDPANLICATCNAPLQAGKAEATYLGQRFPVELPRCPSCGFVYISEELALGKMLKVEQSLEDK
jgi:hypothetical protein